MIETSYHPQALIEVGEAAAYYRDIEPDLARRFLKEVDDAIARIERLPEAWPLVTRYSRRCLLTRFPYALIYELHDGHALIIAVTHLSRDQSYWHSRES